jgi:hypothetical protein
MIHVVRFPFILILLLFVSVFPCIAQSRGMHIEDEAAGAPLSIGKQYCLLIGVSRYSEWLPLENPVRDARALKSVLTSRYRMDECIELYDENATKANIVSTFSRLKGSLSSNDSILIYYAGHGHYEESSDTGFWIPYDAGTDRSARSNWISNSEISDYISRLASIHVFLISDSCFSGGILNLSRGFREMDEFEEASQYFNKAYLRVARQVITSGAFEDVPDKSSFSKALIETLKSNHHLLIDPYILFSEIRLSVKETTPLIGNLKKAGHQDGASFLLFLKEGANVPDSTKAGDQAGGISLCIGVGGGMMLPTAEVGSIMEPGNAFDGYIGIKTKNGPVIWMAGISLGSFYSATNAQSEYAYDILAFSFGALARIGLSFGFLDLFAECSAGAMAAGVDYLQSYAGITDSAVLKPYCEPKAGITIHTPFAVNVSIACGFMALFFDNNPYLAIVPSVRIEYEP